MKLADHLQFQGIILLLILFIPVPTPGQERGNLEVLGERPVTAPVDMGNGEGERSEDPERVERGVADQLPPDQYMKSLRDLGVMDQLAVRGDVTRLKVPGDWERVGPVGGFGSPVRNGRISGIQVLQDGSFYRVYAGACQGGLWRMRSQYWKQWTDIGYNLPNPSVRAFAVDPDDFSHIFVATGDHRRYSGGGLFETHDEGVTWTEATLPFGWIPPYFYKLMILGDDPATGHQRLVAVSSSGPIWSGDGGTTWQRGRDAAGDALGSYWTDLVEHPVENWLFAVRCTDSASGGSGVWFSGDYGEHWLPYSSPALPPSEDWTRASMAISRSNPNRLVVLVTDGNYLAGVYRTDDLCNTWTDITNGLVNSGDPGSSFGGNQTFHAQAVAIKPDDPDHIILGTVHLAESNIGGASWAVGEFWTGIQEGHVDFAHLSFSDITGDDMMWMGNDGGIYYHRFNTTTTYDAIGDHSNGLACSEIDYMDADRNTVGIGLQDNGTLLSIDGGGTWEYVESGDGADIEIVDAVTGGVNYNNGVWSPDPPWRTWLYYYGGSKQATDNPDAYMPRLYYSPFNARIYTHDAEFIYGKMGEEATGWFFKAGSWQPSPYSISNIWGGWGRDDAIWVTYGPDPDGGGEGDEDLTYVYLGGTGWTYKHWENFTSGEPVKCVRPSREWPDEAWVGVKGSPGAAKIYHLREGGDIKENITGSLQPVSQVLAIEVMPFNPEVIWAGTDLGVYWTTDGGGSWQPYMEGLPIGRCSELQFVTDPTHTGDHYLYLAFDGRGVWRRPIGMPPIIYVDERYTTSGDGSIWGGAYKTVAEAVAVAPAGSIIAIHADSYAEPQTVDREVKLVTWQGETLIH
ncbi:MAG: sialidase family protein [bacterium]